MRRWMPSLFWSGLALAPFVGLAFALWRYHFDAPYLDQWEFVLLLDRFYGGTITFGDLWALHNEHRLIFPRLLMLALAWLTHWDIRYELAANLALAIGIFGIYIRQLRVSASQLGFSQPTWQVPLVSLMVFSLSQWQNWFLGWQIQEFMNVLAAVACLALLAYHAGGPVRFAGAAFLGVVATYSFANGMAIWPVGAVVLIAVGERRSRGAVLRLAVWLGIGALAFASYTYGYSTPEYHPLTLRSPLECAAYVLKFLGNPIVCFHEQGAMAAGTVAMAALVALSIRVWQKGVHRQVVAAYWGFALYALGAAVLSSLGRVGGFGSGQAMSSRYITLATPLWIALLALAWIAGASAPRRKLAAAGGFLAATVLAALLTAGYGYGYLKWTERYDFKLPAQAELVSGDDPDLLQRLHPDPTIVLERREILKKYELSVFRK